VRLPDPTGRWVWALDPNPEALPPPELGSPILGIADRLLFADRRLGPREVVQVLVLRRLGELMSRPRAPELGPPPVGADTAWVQAGAVKVEVVETPAGPVKAETVRFMEAPAWVPSAGQVRRRAELVENELRVIDEYVTPAACVAWLLYEEIENPNRRRCPICGQRFDPAGGRKRGPYRNRVYCSDRCRVKAQRLGYRVQPEG
jgi:hypothetical protein